jgi:hypothetical protein
VESILGPLGTSATEWPIVPAPGDYDDGEFGGMKIGRETEVLGENLPQGHIVHHKSYFPDPGSNPARRDGKPVINRLNYGAARICIFVTPQDFFSISVQSISYWRKVCY